MPDLAPAPGALKQTGETGEPRVPFRLFALKDGDTFLVADAYGDILGDGDGLFREDTRLLSRFRFAIGGRVPSLLSAGVGHDNVFFTSHLTNRPLPPLGGRSLPEGVIHIQRSRFLWQDRLYECVSFVNFGGPAAVLPLSFQFAADFRDMFEVRGKSRAARGRFLPPELREQSVLLRYEGLDGMLRSTAISFSEKPSSLTAERAEFALVLPKEEKVELHLEIGPHALTLPGRQRYRAAAARARFAMRNRCRRGARLRSSGRLFNEWLDKSRADLALLTSELSTGPYPYAGIPWFSTPFGRDAIITALQTLWLDTGLARGVLAFLAASQAQETSPFQDAVPGKILHETRKGEMTALRELPFGRYYGGVDTTPLFVMLAGAYARRTGDLAFIDTLWPALEAAMAWIRGLGDTNRDGFLDYVRGAETGLANQGWKDSEDSIFHADGSTPPTPIAVVEVQGYVFAANRAMAELADRRGDRNAARIWRADAERVREAVERRFWLEDLGFYGLAVDGEGRVCRVKASNAGHLLYVGLPKPERGRKVAELLLSPAFSTGWGIRTLAHSEARFNPMSYHNGSVWPHDNSIIAVGLRRYGLRELVLKPLTGLFDASLFVDLSRLPELFCGFHRRGGEGPTLYPVACAPQAWAAGAGFLLLQAALGLVIDGRRRRVAFYRPLLPPFLEEIRIRNLRVGEGTLDLVLERRDNDVGISVPRRDGDIVVSKLS
jgi:glycogen debranching enzyme